MGALVNDTSPHRGLFHHLTSPSHPPQLKQEVISRKTKGDNLGAVGLMKNIRAIEKVSERGWACQGGGRGGGGGGPPRPGHEHLWYPHADRSSPPDADAARAYDRLGRAVDCLASLTSEDGGARASHAADESSASGGDSSVPDGRSSSGQNGVNSSLPGPRRHAVCHYMMGAALQDLGLHAPSVEWYRRTIASATEVRR